MQGIKGQLSANFSFWDEPSWDWNTHWKAITQNIREIGKEKPPKRRHKGALAQRKFSVWLITLHYKVRSLIVLWGFN